MLQELKGKKILQLTHKDLDGAGSYAVASHYLNIPESNVIFVSNSGKDLIMLNALEDLRRGLYDTLLITDLSPSENILSEYLEAITDGLDIVLVDHHPTAKHLSELKSHTVIVEKNGILTSGTSLLYELFISEGFTVNNNLRMISEVVRRYDTWDWNKLKDLHAKHLNMLFYILGDKSFSNVLKNMIKRDSIVEYKYDDVSYFDLFNTTEKTLISVEESRVQNYVSRKLKKVVHSTLKNVFGFKDGSDLKYTYVFAEENINDVAEAMYLEHKEVDFVAVIGFDSISLRTDKDYINVSILAKFFGGGGHPKASGFSTSLKGRCDFVNTSFKGLTPFN